MYRKVLLLISFSEEKYFALKHTINRKKTYMVLRDSAAFQMAPLELASRHT